MHPIGGDVEKNLKNLDMIYKWVTDHYPNIIPFVPYYATVMGLDDSNPRYREIGMGHNEALIRAGIVSEAWWFTDRISTGMWKEIDLFRELSIPYNRVYIDGYN